MITCPPEPRTGPRTGEDPRERLNVRQTPAQPRHDTTEIHVTHRIEKDQEYAFCAAWPDDFRVRVIEPPRREGSLVGIATINDDGRLLRRRRIDGRQLHAERTTRSGEQRRSGYFLVQHADGTPADGSFSTRTRRH